MLQSGHGRRDGRTDGRTDRRTDGRTEWNQYTPQQLRCSGGIIMTIIMMMMMMMMIIMMTIIIIMIIIIIKSNENTAELYVYFKGHPVFEPCGCPIEITFTRLKLALKCWHLLNTFTNIKQNKSQLPITDINQKYNLHKVFTVIFYAITATPFNQTIHPFIYAVVRSSIHSPYSKRNDHKHNVVFLTGLK